MSAKAKKQPTNEEMGAKDEAQLTIWQYLQSQKQFLALFSIRLPFEVRFALKQIKAELFPQLERFNETQNELFKTYEAEKGKAKDSKKQPELDKEFTALLNQPLNTSFEKLPESLFGDNLSISDVERLSWLIQEGV